MNRRGSLLVPFALILSLFSLLLGALAGNVIGRKNTIEAQVGVLDVHAPVVPRAPDSHYPDYSAPAAEQKAAPAPPDINTQK